MKQSLFILTLLAASLTVTSCKKNWVCTHSYLSNPNDPNSVVKSTVTITSKTKREAKNECKSYAGPNDTWELDADKT
ncbi:MAG TPA: hypothetical protein VGE58_08140 [Daejeonella sp.]